MKIIPRDHLVQQAENMGKTVVEAFPDSGLANTYMELAQKMMDSCGGDRN